ncbi:MAG: DUF4301 family protein [Bacteroidales bacterium]|nr:DUF4301 family protein [Bacteroidales bacterium]
MLDAKDLKQIQEKGISEENLQSQLGFFRKGFQYIELDRPAKTGDGILKLEMAEADRYSIFYDQIYKSYEISKFVPASGAATRMFKDLFALRTSLESGVDADEVLLSHKEGRRFIEGIRNFAFYRRLSVALKKKGLDIETCLLEKNYIPLIDTLLEEDGLGYAALPKGLLDFHLYENGARTSFEEHLVEGAVYARGRDGKVKMHFTVSPEHKQRFIEKLEHASMMIEIMYGVKFEVVLSEQKPSTDTVAVTPENELFRDDDGSLLFRPGGHGALIENLNEAVGQVIFIKNIDNVVPDRLKSETIRYKKALGGLLIDYMVKLKNWLERMDIQQLNSTELGQAIDFAVNRLYADPRMFEGLEAEALQRCLRGFFNRPIRICGMVKNEGEPGGGPYWVKGRDGYQSLQIVELSQIDQENPQQLKVLNRSTHFNPVDLVCGVVDYKGNKFDLRHFVDPTTGFISMKSKGSRELKALELPGLWNGAMAGWISVFVEVPLITFNPVKTINDLLRKEHQAE